MTTQDTKIDFTLIWGVKNSENIQCKYSLFNKSNNWLNILAASMNLLLIAKYFENSRSLLFYSSTSSAYMCRWKIGMNVGHTPFQKMKCITLVPKFSVELFIHNFNDANVLEKFSFIRSYLKGWILWKSFWNSN